MTDHTDAQQAATTPSFADLAGAVAVVTGGSGTLGGAASRALAANGAVVAVGGRDRSAIDATVDQIRAAGGQAIAAIADCTDRKALEQMGHDVADQLGPVDVLVAFAGGGRQPTSILELTEQEWREDLERNLTATFLTITTFLPAMIERGRGAIITMSSSAARRAGGAPIAYAAAKAGIIALTEHVAHEVGPRGIRVNCLAPAAVPNDQMRQAIPEEQRQQMTDAFPLRRLGTPDDVANATLYLASNASSWLTGVTLDIAGGQIMR